MLKLWRKYWYYIGGVLFVAAAFAMGFWGAQSLSRIQVILVFSWMAMLVHQFEEYALPGGFPLISNFIGSGEVEHPEESPLNQLQCFVSNVIFCYLAYLIPVFFPNLIWMGASQVFAGVLQLQAHGFSLNRKLKSVYSPGLGAVVFLQIPLAVYYIYYVCAYMQGNAWQLLLGVPGALLLLLFVFLLPIRFMKGTGHPFEERELYGYKREFVKKELRNARSKTK